MKKAKHTPSMFQRFVKKIKNHERLSLMVGIGCICAIILFVSLISNSPTRTTDTHAQQADTYSVGGQPVADGEYPFVVYLTNADGSWFCSGSLISDQWVLSNAHCDFATQVAIGFHSLANPISPSCNDDIIPADAQCYVRIVEKVIHPNYTGDQYNDLMLVKLEKIVQHEPISLPADKNLIDRIKYGQLVGYGVTDEDTDFTLPSDRLKYGIIDDSDNPYPVIANKVNGEIMYISSLFNDRYAYYDSRLVYPNATNSYGSQGGDSGGPVLAWSGRDQKMYQISINRAGGGGFAGSSIAHHLDWIRNTTGIDNFESEFRGQPITIEGSAYSLGYTCEQQVNSVNISWNIANPDSNYTSRDGSKFKIRVMVRNDSDVNDPSYNHAIISFFDNPSEENDFIINQETLTTTEEPVNINNHTINVDSSINNFNYMNMYNVFIYKLGQYEQNVVIDCAFTPPELDGIRNFSGNNNGNPRPQSDTDFTIQDANIPMSEDFNCPHMNLEGVFYNCTGDNPIWAGCYEDRNNNSTIMNTCRSADGSSEVYIPTNATINSSQSTEPFQGGSEGSQSGGSVSCFTNEYCGSHGLGSCSNGSCSNARVGQCEQVPDYYVPHELEAINPSFEACTCERYGSSSNQSGLVPPQCGGGRSESFTGGGAEGQSQEGNDQDGNSYILPDGTLHCPLGTLYWDSGTSTCVCTNGAEYTDVAGEAYGDGSSITVQQCANVNSSDKITDTFPPNVR